MRDEEQDSHTGGPASWPSLTESGASSAPQDSQKLSVAPTGAPQAKHTVAARPGRVRRHSQVLGRTSLAWSTSSIRRVWSGASLASAR